MSMDIHLASVRRALKPRREPYWAAPIERGKFVGFRKLDNNTGTWIVRGRDESGRHQYRSLGYATEAFGFDEAKKAARVWFKLLESGISSDVITVADACRQYVEDRKREKGAATAHDAEIRFKKIIYDNPHGLPSSRANNRAVGSFD